MDDIHVLVGYLVGVYRKYYNEHYTSYHQPLRWSERGFVFPLRCRSGQLDCAGCLVKEKCKYDDDITFFTRNTLRKLEEGGLVREVYYDYAVTRLCKKFEKRDIDLVQYFDELYQVIVFSDINEMKRFLKKVKKTFKEARGLFLYEDIYQFSIEILQYQIDDKPISLEKTLQYLHCLNTIPEHAFTSYKIIELIYYFVFYMLSNFYFRAEEIDVLFSMHKRFKETPFLYMMEARYLYYRKNGKLKRILKLLDLAIVGFKKDENINRLIQCFGLKAAFMSYFDTDETWKTYKQVEDLIVDNRDKIPLHQINRLFFGEAVFYMFAAKDKQTALEKTYLQSYKDELSVNIQNIIILYLYSAIHNDIPYELLKQYDKCKDKDYKVMLHYYRLKRDILNETDKKKKKLFSKQASEHIANHLIEIFKTRIQNRLLTIIFGEELSFLNQYYNNARVIVEYGTILDRR